MKINDIYVQCIWIDICILLFDLVWIVSRACYLPQVQDHHQAGDEPAQQVDDGHGGAEADEVGGGTGPEQADGHDLEDDADDVDQKSNNDGFSALRLNKTPE